tara:strand:- start:112 stop:579 length:468 start_codon:yes stop_codon:yes gene_type:complete
VEEADGDDDARPSDYWWKDKADAIKMAKRMGGTERAAWAVKPYEGKEGGFVVYERKELLPGLRTELDGKKMKGMPRSVRKFVSGVKRTVAETASLAGKAGTAALAAPRVAASILDSAMPTKRRGGRRPPRRRTRVRKKKAHIRRRRRARSTCRTG